MRVKISQENGTLLIVINDNDISKLKNGNKYFMHDYPFDGNITSTFKLSDISHLVIKYEQ